MHCDSAQCNSGWHSSNMRLLNLQKPFRQNRFSVTFAIIFSRLHPLFVHHSPRLHDNAQQRSKGKRIEKCMQFRFILLLRQSYLLIVHRHCFNNRLEKQNRLKAEKGRDEEKFGRSEKPSTLTDDKRCAQNDKNEVHCLVDLHAHTH